MSGEGGSVASVVSGPKEATIRALKVVDKLSGALGQDMRLVCGVRPGPANERP